MSRLQPVTFSRRQAPEPRLSKPYVPGRHSPRFWTEAEKDVLRQHFADRGAAYCASLLPNRQIGQIYQQAHKLGVKSASTPKQRQNWRARFPEIDAQIQEAWPSLHGKGAITAFAESIGVARFVVSKRAIALGLSMPHRKEPPWSPAEDLLLQKVPKHDPKRASEIFKAHGFYRTEAAITGRCKRLGLSRRDFGALSAGAAARILGVDSKWVTAQIFAGDLKATRRGTKRTVQQGGDSHAIERGDLRQFIIDHLDRIDFRKVDKFAVVAILTASAQATASDVDV